MTNPDDLLTHIKGFDGDLSPIDKKDKTAGITLYMVDGTVLRGKFAFYTLPQLKSLPIFKEAKEGKEDILVNRWHTKTAPGVIIKFATEKNLAFVFTSEHAPEERFNLFVQVARSICNDDRFKGEGHSYFDEVRFINLITSRNLTMDLLRSHLSERKISFLVEHQFNFETLLENGLELRQIKDIKPRVFTLSGLHAVLTLVTLEQILGKSHIAPPVPKVEFRDSEWTPSIHNKARTDGPFKSEYANNLCDVSYRHKKTGNLLIMSLNAIRPKADARLKLENEMKDLLPERLIHNWYHLPESRSGFSGFLTRRIYSPELNLAIVQKIAPHFPVKLYNDMFKVPKGIDPTYYKELRFTNYLMKKGYPLESFRQYPGMTHVKLMTLCTHFEFLDFLLERGMALTDFATIDENRLLHVFDNEYYARTALSLVKPAELFNLRQRSLRASSSMFSHMTSEIDESSGSDDDQECSRAASSVPVV